METTTIKRAHPYFRLWADVPDEERYGATWVKNYITDQIAAHPDREAWWREKGQRAEWAERANDTVNSRLKPGGCAAAVLWSANDGVWAPCSYRHTEGDTLCKTHRRMADKAATVSA